MDITTTKARHEAAVETKRRRAAGQTWPVITEALGFSESTGRKLLKELDDNGFVTDENEPVRDGKPLSPAYDELPEDQPTPVVKDDEAPKPRSGRYLKLECGCGHVIRTSKTVAEKASVRCDTCKKVFAEA